MTKLPAYATYLRTACPSADALATRHGFATSNIPGYYVLSTVVLHVHLEILSSLPESIISGSTLPKCNTDNRAFKRQLTMYLTRHIQVHPCTHAFCLSKDGNKMPDTML
jgi:hypothetical protein